MHKLIAFTLLVLTFVTTVSCNKVSIQAGATRMEVIAPSQMLTGHCTPWTIHFQDSSGNLTGLSQSSSVSLSLSSGGAPVAGAEIFSDSGCTTPITALAVSKGTRSTEVYVKYNIAQNLQLNVTHAKFGSETGAITLTSQYTRTELLAGAHEPYGYLEGIGDEARMSTTAGIATDGTYLYVSSYYYHTIERVHIATRQLTHFVGIDSTPGSANGVGTLAQLRNPQGLTVLGTHLYVADRGNHVIRRVNLMTQVVDTVAGTVGVAGSADGIGTAATFNSPLGITTDGTYLYVSDYGTHIIRKIDPTTAFTVSTIAGGAGVAGNVDDIGTAARLSGPVHLSSDGAFLYFPDHTGHVIRKLDLSNNSVSTLAGTYGATGPADGTGAAARFSLPYCARYDSGYLYIADATNHMIRRLNLANNSVVTLAGAVGVSTHEDGAFATSKFNYPSDVVVIGNVMYLSEV